MPFKISQMTDVWDFSNLLANWSKVPAQSEKETRDFPEVQSQLDAELAKLQSQLESLKNPSSMEKNETNFLTTPLPPLSPEPTPTPTPHQTEFAPIATPRRIESALEKRPKPIAQLTKPTTANKIVKPREAFILHTQRQYKQKIAQKFDYYFKADPPELKVVNFSLNTEYIMTFTIQNITSNTKGFQLRGPLDKAFRFRMIEGVENSLIRPGLHLTFEVIFYPEEPRDYESAFLFIPGPDEPITKVPIKCFRDPPVLELPDIVDLNAALVYSVQKGTFTITNTGGTAFFSFKSNGGKESDDCYVDGSFSLKPSSFELQNGESIEIEITFSPSTTGEHKVSFDILPQYFPQKFYFIAQGISSNPSLKFQICDDKQLFVPFLPEDSGKTRCIEIINDTDVEYPFHVQTVPLSSDTSELFALYPEHKMCYHESVAAPFIIFPICGKIQPKQKIPLNIKFDPIMFSAYSTRLLVFADQIPDITGHKVSVKMLTINIEASTGSTSVIIQPPLVIYNNIVPKTNMVKSVALLNKSFLDINLQWRKSDLITPSPVIFEVKPNNETTVELNCLLLKKSTNDKSKSIIFKHQPDLEIQAKQSGVWHISSKSNQTANDQNSNVPKSPSSKLYAINFTEYDSDHRGDGDELYNDVDNLNSGREIKKSTSAVFKKSIGVMPSLINSAFLKQVQGAHLTDEVSFSMNTFNDLTFTYTATLNPPLLHIYPSILEFGCVLTELTASEVITFENHLSCPIGYIIDYPNRPEWTVHESEGFVTEKKNVFVNLRFDDPGAVEELITITTFWCDDSGHRIETLPCATFDLPVIAIFDRPIVQVKDRVLDIGNVFPTLEYTATTEISLLNLFPTNYEFINASYSVKLSMPDDDTTKEIHYNAIPFESDLPENGSGEIKKVNSTIIDTIENDGETTLYEYTKAFPVEGELDPNHSKTAKVDLIACFCRLGENALPFVCKTSGPTYRCAVIAHVQPPEITLITEKIDFSSDFVICNRSCCFVKVKNECGVASTVQVQMVDNCNDVFSLDDDKVFQVAPFATVEIPVSCYSEIHGDYNGSLKLKIKDPWQYKEIDIPMHVKALGSFFGFKKHTLGYTNHIDGDFVSFGEEIYLSKTPKVIRRLTLVNFSSESITVDWSISNFAKGRKYANVDLDLDDNGEVILNITETKDANIQNPFKLMTEKSVIESHGKTVVVVEFTPKGPGTYGGCVAARSGEFIHTLGLHAVVYE